MVEGWAHAPVDGSHNQIPDAVQLVGWSICLGEGVFTRTDKALRNIVFSLATNSTECIKN